MTIETASRLDASRFYHDSCIALAKSMVLKSTATAIAMNNEVNRQYGAYGRQYVVDTSDPKSWRYYHHLQGKYHYTDQMMQVRSLDTLQTIDFTSENMQLHRTTWQHYKEKGEYYYDLLAKYPDQHLLIDGICNPVDFDTAYNAEEYTILTYDTRLVERQEVDLIPLLNKQIKAVMKRFHSRGYNAFDEMFMAVKLGILGTQLPGMIIALREQYIKTEQAHSFHIWNYLGSYFELDKYKRFLTHEQAMWLYRHLPYIDRNAGKQDTFLDIVHWMLTHRGIPLYGYNIGRDTSEILEYKDTPDVYREQINLKHLNFKSDEDHLSLPKLIDKEKDQAQRNVTFRNVSLNKSYNRYYRSKYSNQKSKVLESEVFDYSNHQIKPLSILSINYWAQLAVTNRYNLVTSINNPATGEPISLDALEGFIVWLYCAMKLADFDDQENDGKWVKPIKVEDRLIPDFIAKDIIFDRVNWTDLRNNFIDRRADIKDALDDLQEHIPLKSVYYSAERFRELVKSVQSYFGRIRHWLGVHHDLLHYGEIKQLGERLFFQEKLPLHYRNMTFREYLNQKHFEITTLTRAELFNFASQIQTTFTGGDIDDEATLTETQEAMVGILRQLSSYSVQFTSKANAVNARVLDMSWLRYGRIITTQASLINSHRHFLAHFHIRKGYEYNQNEIGIIYTDSNTHLSTHETGAVLIPPPVRFFVGAQSVHFKEVRLGLLGFRRITQTKVPPKGEFYYYIFNGTLYRYYYGKPDEIEAKHVVGVKGIAPPPTVTYRQTDRETFVPFAPIVTDTDSPFDVNTKNGYETIVINPRDPSYPLDEKDEGHIKIDERRSAVVDEPNQP